MSAKRTACPCCALVASQDEMTPWRQRTRAKALAVSPPPRAAMSEPLTEGLYRYYVTESVVYVCADCAGHLSAGGAFGGLFRDRLKLALMVVAIIVVALSTTLPIWLPSVQSALFNTPSRDDPQVFD